MAKKNKTKKPCNTIGVGHDYMQTNTNNVNKKWFPTQTTGGKEQTEHPKKSIDFEINVKF